MVVQKLKVKVKQLILHYKLIWLVKVAESEYAVAKNNCGHDAQYRLHILKLFQVAVFRMEQIYLLTDAREKSLEVLIQIF